jgi:very-short-patch-repair endonuclease
VVAVRQLYALGLSERQVSRRAEAGWFHRDRDSRLAAHGFRILRLTWWDVTARLAVVADRVRRVLAGR